MWILVGLLCVCAAPTFWSRLHEDFTKRVSPRRRMPAIALSGVLGAVLLKAVILRTGWGWFDQALVYPAAAMLRRSSPRPA